MGPDRAVAAVRRAVRLALADVDGPVLVACSGGADSLALAAALAFEAPRSGIAAGLITIDHGLQRESAVQARRVAAIGYELGFDPVQVVAVEVGGEGGPEAAARAARYAALESAATAAGALVLLGHTLDDQAETVLLGLGRGSGPRSIAGMRAVDGCFLRPMLGLRRATTEAACAALGFLPWDDPHNADRSFQRARLRHEALPLLEEILQAGVAEALARTATLVRADLDALDAITDERYPSVISALSAKSGRENRDHPQQVGLDVAALAAQPAAIRTRVLRRWVSGGGAGPLTSTHLAALDVLVTGWHGQGGVDLPGGYAVTRASGRLSLLPPTKE
jgi:tRNA(Ile)-lysidine synthase